MSGQGAHLEPGTTLAGRYRLLSAGVAQDVGVVHDAYDTAEDRPVTVLVLPPGRLPGAEALRRLIEVQERVAGLQQQGLVPYEHAGILAGRVYLVRPSLPQRSLAQILASGAPLDAGAAIEIALRLSELLAPLHRAGIVHGSLSPYSVLAGQQTPSGARASEWTVSVVDIGLLPALQSGEAAGRRGWGRSPFFSPEQAQGLEARPSSDVYVVASLLYTMLAGRPPFRGADAALVALQHERQEPPSLEILVSGISPRLVEAVQKSLDKEPAHRCRNAGQMAYVLRGLWAETLAGRRAPAGPGGRGQLVVPAPTAVPDREVAPVLPAIPAHEGEREPAMANVLTVLLLILALVAVLGLIPLWQTLYRRYAAPAATPTPALEGWQPAEELTDGAGLVAGRIPLPERRAADGPPAPVAGAEAARGMPPGPGNWSRGPFSVIIDCCPSVCRALWSQDYGFFWQHGLL